MHNYVSTVADQPKHFKQDSSIQASGSDNSHDLQVSNRPLEDVK
ncbi:MAG: hypothetical protein ACI81A_000704 [Paraglaciecola sp.]|jgi:hypothetical protein